MGLNYNKIVMCIAVLISLNVNAKAAPERPNVVLILIDDLSHYGVTAYGANRLKSLTGHFDETQFSTPNIDNIAKSGLKADHAYAYPLCENTRVAIMSGKGNHRNYLRPKALHHSDLTFGDAFKRAGYKTGLFGKWKQSRGTKEIKGKDYLYEFGWDEFTAFDVVTAGARMINPDLIVNGEKQNYKGRTDVDPLTGRRWYGPDIVNRDALTFIEKNKEQPFFLYYPMLLVHDEHTPTPDTLPKSAFDNFPEHVAGDKTRKGDDKKYFPDMVEYTDKLIGNVARKLKESGLSENTLLIVIGDNGTKEAFAHILPNGQVWPARKGGNTDNGLHVPLVMSMPGTIPNIPTDEDDYRTYQGLVDVTDIYPTIAEAAGIEMPKADLVDGISFWKQAKGELGEPRDHIYRWYIANEKYHEFDDIGLSFVFNRDFKRYEPTKSYPEGRFFDLRIDPLERSGGRYKQFKFKVRRYKGLDVNKLTISQKSGYQQLGSWLNSHQYAPITALTILQPITRMHKGKKHQLDYSFLPNNAQRTGVIWQSSDPSVIDVNKFGEVTAKRAGKATISMYSWEDAYPVAYQRKDTFFKNGVRDTIKIEVK